MQDLLVNLFKAYKAVTDHEFVSYIKKRRMSTRKG